MGKTITISRALTLSIINIRDKCFTKEKEQIIKKKEDTIQSLQSELASLEIKGSVDADEDIGVVKVSRAIDGVFDIGESSVESMEVHSKFSEFSENKESIEEFVVGSGEALGVDEDESNRVSVLKDGGGEFDDSLNEINLGLGEELVIRVFEGRDVFGESLVIFFNFIWVQILCGISGVNKLKFSNKDVAMGKEAKIQKRI
ncbi:hypothetical protein Tco_0422101 [Tanacetum coccineum]